MLREGIRNQPSHPHSLLRPQISNLERGTRNHPPPHQLFWREKVYDTYLSYASSRVARFLMLTAVCLARFILVLVRRLALAVIYLVYSSYSYSYS